MIKIDLTRVMPTEPADAPAIPDELASLASNFSALPDHIRHAIATLAGT
jgi:hypothetical protein